MKRKERKPGFASSLVALLLFEELKNQLELQS